MKKIIIFALSAFLFTIAYAENKTVSFTVKPPLVCNNCENKIKDNFRFEKGVKAVKPSAKKGRIDVTYDASKTNIDSLKAGFQRIGYEVTLITEEQTGNGCCETIEVSTCCEETPVSSCCTTGEK